MILFLSGYICGMLVAVFALGLFHRPPAPNQNAPPLDYRSRVRPHPFRVLRVEGDRAPDVRSSVRAHARGVQGVRGLRRSPEEALRAPEVP
jgi:hypothetical protein